MNKYTLSIVAIICISGLEIVALSFKINGLALSLSVGAICTIVGWALGSFKKRSFR